MKEEGWRDGGMEGRDALGCMFHVPGDFFSGLVSVEQLPVEVVGQLMAVSCRKCFDADLLFLCLGLELYRGWKGR